MARTWTPHPLLSGSAGGPEAVVPGAWPASGSVAQENECEERRAESHRGRPGHHGSVVRPDRDGASPRARRVAGWRRRGSPRPHPTGRSMAARAGNPGRWSGSNGSQIAVSVGPGDTRVSRTPVPRYSATSVSCSPRSPYLLGGVGGVLRKADVIGHAADAHVRTPAERRRIDGSSSRATRNAARRLTRTCSSNSAGVVSASRLSRKPPALLHHDVGHAGLGAHPLRQPGRPGPRR